MLFRRSRANSWAGLLAMPWRGLSQRFSFVFFSSIALILLAVSHADPHALSSLRTHTIDSVAPVLDAIARPMAAMERIGASFRETLNLRGANQQLRDENAHMAEWQNAVLSLRKENRELRDLLRFKTEPGLAYISARVIADTGGSYARGLIVTAGKTDGVREGMAAMTGDGLIGRVVEAGDWSSRILLITDLNSRVPVSIAESGDRAILSGDNSPQPQLLFMPHDAASAEGAHVVTSGHGGVFPPNLPVGVLHATARGDYTVTPAADLSRVTYVRLVDFDLKGGAFNGIETRLKNETRKK